MGAEFIILGFVWMGPKFVCFYICGMEEVRHSIFKLQVFIYNDNTTVFVVDLFSFLRTTPPIISVGIEICHYHMSIIN